MVAAEFLSYAKDLCVANYLGVEDFADKCNFLWNVMVILICMLIVTVRGYFMESIVCYIATTIGGSNIEGYVVNLCWVEGTYPMDIEAGLPDSPEKWNELKPTILNYYQWVPFVLALQAITYYLPRLIWQIFAYNHTGTDLQNLITSASKAASETGETREKSLANIISTLEELLFDRRNFRQGKMSRFHSKFSFLPGKRQGNNILASYIVIKFFYALVGILNLILMYYFLRFNLKDNFFFFGYHVLSDIIQGRTWEQTNVFPRVGVCQQTVRVLGNKDNSVTAQCVLPINMLNEKIYIFLFFYLFAILLITFLSIPLWFWRTAFLRRQTHFIRRFLKMSSDYNDLAPYSVERREVHRFVEEFLRQDGHFLIRILAMNAGDIITKDIVNGLFDVYKKKYSHVDFRNCHKEPDFSCVKIENGGQAVTKRVASPTAPPEKEDKELLYNFIEKDVKSDLV